MTLIALATLRYLTSIWERARSSAVMYQMPGDPALYWYTCPCASVSRVAVTPPPTLLNTSEPEQATVTLFPVPWMTCLAAQTARSAGAFGRARGTLPLVVSQGTKSPAASVYADVLTAVGVRSPAKFRLVLPVPP